ncbi:hypothetical protein [Paenibacillus lutrae]|uniref:Uncharacterized protein n=1 Tax=Paenibacillus lutrae TaxID=2078573 RepID=A0A7X3FM66_9BACL|nr:hypothetical protein [Paenibacillus lutrae]MVP02294.1 hypothetical protein [Paenibacillus lutrae]
MGNTRKRNVILFGLFSAVVAVVYYLIQLIQGMVLTLTYVPDVTRAYENVEVLNQQVSFDSSASMPYLLLVEIALFMLAGALITLICNKVIRRQNASNRV